jgi:DNA-binding response OmpR family regulator
MLHHALEAGAVEYIQKPFEAGELVKITQRVLSKSAEAP